MAFIPDVVAAKQSASDWRDAIRLVGKLYEAEGIATNEYTEAMIAGVEDYGPYMVLTPHVAMPHAKTTSGVNRGGAVVVTLSEPVEFGSPANDPVDILISFAAGENKEHMTRVVELAKVLGNTELLERARQATSDEDLMKVFTD